MILSTKLLRPVMRGEVKQCCKCGGLAGYYDAALPVEAPEFYCSVDALLEDLDPDEFGNQHTLTGAVVSRKTEFPDCMDIEELFARTKVVMPPTKRHSLQMWANVVDSRQLYEWDVVARPAVWDWIQENSIYGSEVPLERHYYVQVNRWEDRGVALVTLKFQQIIGSHYLAIVPWETVEKFFGVRPQ